MTDREKVIKGLTEVSEYMRAKADIAGVGKGKEVFDSWYRAAEDALALLKSHEPKIILNKDYFTQLDAMIGTCPSCGETMVSDKDRQTRFCRHCGQALKWND